MFNTYNDHIHKHYNSKTEYITNIKQAPSEDSLKLINEYQQLAISSILDSVVVNNNVISGAIAVMSDFRTTGVDSTVVLIKFIINGKQYKFETSFSGVVFSVNAKDKLIKLFAEQLSKYITEQLIKSTILNDNDT